MVDIFKVLPTMGGPTPQTKKRGAADALSPPTPQKLPANAATMPGVPFHLRLLEQAKALATNDFTADDINFYSRDDWILAKVGQKKFDEIPDANKWTMLSSLYGCMLKETLIPLCKAGVKPAHVLAAVADGPLHASVWRNWLTLAEDAKRKRIENADTNAAEEADAYGAPPDPK